MEMIWFQLCWRKQEGQNNQTIVLSYYSCIQNSINSSVPDPDECCFHYIYTIVFRIETAPYFIYLFANGYSNSISLKYTVMTQTKMPLYLSKWCNEVEVTVIIMITSSNDNDNRSIDSSRHDTLVVIRIRIKNIKTGEEKAKK